MDKKNLIARIIATIIDYTLIFILYFVFIMAFGKPQADGNKSIDGVIVLLPLLLGFVYLVITETFFNVTLGHKLM